MQKRDFVGIKEMFGIKPKAQENGQGKAKAGAAGGQKAQAAESEGKYDEPCAMCGGGGTDKKWMGQYWHRKCIRSTRKFAKGMF